MYIYYFSHNEKHGISFLHGIKIQWGPRLIISLVKNQYMAATSPIRATSAVYVAVAAYLGWVVYSPMPVSFSTMATKTILHGAATF